MTQNRRQSRPQEQQGPPKDYKKIGSVWEKKDYPGQYNISIDSYYGDIIFKKIEEDQQQGLFRELFYKVKYISLYDPKAYGRTEPPANLWKNMVIDLNNEKQVEFLGASEWQPLTQSDGGEGQGEAQ